MSKPCQVAKLRDRAPYFLANLTLLLAGYAVGDIAANLNRLVFG